MPGTVLLAEDSPDVREAFVELLSTAGWGVVAVGDGHAAVERAVALRPDAVVVDVGLPGIDGLEVARRIRGSLGAAPFLVAVTGHGRSDDRRAALAAGFDVHLVKPVDVEELMSVLSRGRG
ncbi:MAG TPA: response regulator [Anaeromyxobacteraceae bacterium]|nr:response regulator [Anaeromyxobacteraceae bacterium]